MTEIFKIYKLEEDEVIRINSSDNKVHVHDFEELIIGIEGSFKHFIDFQETTFDAPYVSYVAKGKTHRAQPILKDGKCKHWVIRFKSEFIPETIFQLYAHYHSYSNIKLEDNACFARLLSICEMIHFEMNEQKQDFSIVRNLLSVLLTMIEAERKKVSDYVQDGFHKTQSSTFKDFLELLENHFKEPNGVEFYAEKLFMSSRNLNMISQSIMQQSISSIIETRKLIEAKNILITTDKTIAEIGFELGYNEKSYFTSVFKKKSGQTPSEFRKDMIQRNG